MKIKRKEKKIYIYICLFFKSQCCSKISIGNTKSSILEKLTTLQNLKIQSTKNFDTIAKMTPIWAMDSKSSCINIENRGSQRIFKNSPMLLRLYFFCEYHNRKSLYLKILILCQSLSFEFLKFYIFLLEFTKLSYEYLPFCLKFFRKLRKPMFLKPLQKNVVL